MVISGNWRVCEDGVLRPVIPAEVQAGDGSWHAVVFLVDTGADRTVLSEEVFRDLGLVPLAETTQLQGVGGEVGAVRVETAIRMTPVGGGEAVFRSRYPAVTDPAYLDLCVLGRDIINLFALLVDRPREVVCLLGQNHRYQIVQT